MLNFYFFRFLTVLGISRWSPFSVAAFHVFLPSMPSWQNIKCNKISSHRYALCFWRGSCGEIILLKLQKELCMFTDVDMEALEVHSEPIHTLERDSLWLTGFLHSLMSDVLSLGHRCLFPPYARAALYGSTRQTLWSGRPGKSAMSGRRV